MSAQAQMNTEKNPRGVLPTYVTKEELVLCKSAPSIRNTYEIRLALYFAVKDKRRFVLRAPKNAQIEPSLKTVIAQNGGVVDDKKCEDYTVHISHFGPDGKETDGWVLGDKTQFLKLKASIQDSWLRDQLTAGATISGENVAKLGNSLQKETITQKNIDKENIGQALTNLVQICKQQGGFILIQ
jgi:hypothetical protein